MTLKANIWFGAWAVVGSLPTFDGNILHEIQMYNSYDTDTAMVTKYNALKTKWGAERWGGFPQVRQLQIRRYADTGDNSINFHTLMILSTAGNTST